MSNAALKPVSANAPIHFSVHQGDLITSLSHVQSVVEKRGTIPILSNVRIDVQKDAIEMTSTDMELAIIDRAPAEVKSSGSFTLSVNMFYDIAKKFASDAVIDLHLDDSGNKVTIISGRSSFVLPTLPVEDFPAITEDLDLPNSFVLTGSECRALIEKTSIAMANDDTRYFLNGIYLHVAESQGSAVLRSVATDGHRLARMEVPLPSGAADMPSVILPRKAVNELLKLLDKDVTEVKLSVSESKAMFVCGNAVLVSKLLDGQYPDYERVIPQKNDQHLELGAVAFSKALDRVTVVSSDKTRNVRCAIDGSQMIITTVTNEQSTGEEHLEISSSDISTDIGFNSRYLLDVLSRVEGNTLRMHIGDATAPVILQDADNEYALYVVMPVRV